MTDQLAPDERLPALEALLAGLLLSREYRLEEAAVVFSPSYEEFLNKVGADNLAGLALESLI